MVETEEKSIKEKITDDARAMGLVWAFWKRLAPEKTWDEMMASTNWASSPECLMDNNRFIGVITQDDLPKDHIYFKLSNLYDVIMVLKDAKVNLSDATLCTPKETLPGRIFIKIDGFPFGLLIAPLMEEG